MRAIIYTRYSSENQKEASINDQIRVCERLAEQHGWPIEKVYADHSISGTTQLRPQFQKMLNDAHAKRFDIVISESLDRLSRDQEHIAGLHKQLRYLQIPIITVAEGEISEIHI